MPLEGPRRVYGPEPLIVDDLLIRKLLFVTNLESRPGM